jgi:hypothetical protein
MKNKVFVVMLISLSVVLVCSGLMILELRSQLGIAQRALAAAQKSATAQHDALAKCAAETWQQYSELQSEKTAAGSWKSLAQSASDDYTVIVEPAPLTPGRQLIADAVGEKYSVLAGLASQLLRSTESGAQQNAYQPVYVLRGRAPVFRYPGGKAAMFWYYDAAAKSWSGPFPAGALAQ